MRKNLRNALVGGAVAIALVGSTAPLSVTSVAAAAAGPIEAATVTPTSGSKTTAFQLNLGANPACPGDSATGGYRWQTFLVPDGTDLEQLTFGSNGPVSPDGGFASPLFDTFSEAVVNKSTAQAVGSDPEGGIFGIPSFSFAVFDDGDLPPGQYTAGVACTKGPFGPVQVSNLWTVDLRVTATPSGPSWSTDDAPVDNGVASLSVVAGDSATAFSLGLGANPSCPGDSAGAGYRWQTFMVPASADLSALSFTTAGPVTVDGEFRSPLFSLGGDPVANRLTDQAVGPAVTGGISGVPQMNLAVYEPGDIPAGEYAVGVACTLGVPGADQLKSYWSTTVAVTTNSGGSDPALVDWVGVPGAPVALTTDLAEGSVELSWDAAGSDSSAATTGYLVTTAAGIRSCVAPGGTTSCTVAGLPTDGEFSFVVRAVGPAGTSAASSPSNAVTPGAGSATPQFSDVSAGAYFVRAVSMLKDRGITQGKSATRYAPEDQVTREEMAAFLHRLAGSPEAPACTFRDQASIAVWARPAACCLKEQGITEIDPYLPKRRVNRAEMAAFLHRFAGLPEAPACTFRDQTAIPTWARPAACWLKDRGITEIDPYRPGDQVNRAEMAAFLYRTGAVLGLWLRA